MPRKPYKPQTADGINTMLTAFNTNINANSKALATKYGVAAADLTRIAQAQLVWAWFMDALGTARQWSASLTQTRDMMETAPPGPTIPLPGGPALPAVPNVPGVPATPVQLEPGFMRFFTGLVAQIKNRENYDPADGYLLGIEGAEIPAPSAPTTQPVVTGEITTGGEPELTCKKGLFQGFTAFLTRPGAARKNIGFSSSRHFLVTEPLPAPGTAEVWTFEVQYRYQNAPFGQMSQPINLTVRG